MTADPLLAIAAISRRSRTEHGVEARGEVPLLAGLGRSFRQRTALALPFRQAAVEDRDVLMAEHPEHPPGARRRKQANGVVDDDLLPSPMPIRRTAAENFSAARQHMGQGVRSVGDRVDVEELRAGNMLDQILGVGIAALGREMPRGIEDDEVRRVEMRRPASRSSPDSHRLFLHSSEG